MADKTEKPIVFRQFKGAIDENFVDPNDISIEFVAKTTNLTPFRKIGSLVQSPGLTLETAHSGLPTPVGFNYSDSHIFSIDRDKKEIRIITFKSETETKMFIKPYWNPDFTFSNHNPNKAVGWINEWLELTEKYTGTIESGSIGNYVFDSVDLTPSVSGFGNDYFNGWFVVNTTVPNYYENKFNYVTDYDSTNKRFTLKSKILPTDSRNWLNNNHITLVRFPVCYFCDANTPGKDSPYANANVFNFKPTQFVYHQGQLRMPCGTEHKPLVLDMIFERKYLQGDNSMSYDGFWFDYQQPQQVLKDSQVSAFKDLLNPVTSLFIYYDPTIADESAFSPTPPTEYLRFKYVGSSIETIRIVSFIDTSSPAIPFAYSYSSGIHILHVNREADPSLLAFVAYFQPILNGLFEITQSGSAAFLLASFDARQTFVYGATGGYGFDGGGNTMATNLFLGSYVEVAIADDIGDKRMPFILSLTLDNRNEVIIAHGNAKVGAEFSSIYLKFNTWFSRKITHLNLYNGDDEVTTVDSIPTVLAIAEYPYFAWLKVVRINELPLLSQVSFEGFGKAINGELPITTSNSVDLDTGINSFTFFETSWYTVFSSDNNGLETKGTGFKFIVNTNRFIDQDITLNYTRSCFIPQTNGRFFLVGVKNSIVSPIYESSDSVHFNTFAVGVSAYDIFTLDKYISVGVGDRDFNLDIFNFKGYILVFKEQNYYLLDVRTPNEVDYRVVDTFTGRGAVDYKSLCQTGYGIVVPAKDTIYLATHEGIKPLLTSINGRLQLYRDTFLSGSLQTVYYSDYNEVMIFKTSQEDSLAQPSYCLVYNFEYNQWTDYEFGKDTTKDVRIVKAMVDSNKNVILVNYKDIDNYNFVKLSESSFSFINVEGTSEVVIFDFETHSISLSNHLMDLNLEWISLILGLSSNGVKKLSITDTRKVGTDLSLLATSYSMETPDTSSIKNIDNIFDIETVSSIFQNNKLKITNKVGSTKYEYKYFSIDQIILWIFAQSRQKFNKIFP